MSEQLEFWVGNLDPPIGDQVLNEDGSVVDLSTATVRFRMRALNSTTLKVDQPVTTKDALGNWTYQWTAPDVDTAGNFLTWVAVTRAGRPQDVNESVIRFLEHGPLAHAYLEVEEWKADNEMVGNNYANQAIINGIVSASRVVDDICGGRRFWPDTDALQVRYYSPDLEGEIWIDDLITLTSVQTAPGSDGVFSETWTLDTDFILEPFDAPGKGEPWRTIRRLPASRFLVPTRWPHSVKVTGKFGWAAAPAPVRQMTSIIATQLVMRVRSAPWGVIGIGNEGQAIRINRDDPQVKMLAALYANNRGMGLR